MQGQNDFYDYYYFSTNSNFIVNFVGDKIPEFKKQTFFINNNDSKHYFIYKDIGKLNKEFKPIFLSNRLVYDFRFGTINVIEGKCIIIDSDPISKTFKESKSIQFFADFFIPTFQNIRSDIINKLQINKIQKKDINSYLNNAYVNKNFMNINFVEIDDEELFIPKKDSMTKGLETKFSKKNFSDFRINVSLALRNII